MKPHSPSVPADLRHAAEARLKKRPVTKRPRTKADVERLQHELEVHQIELEMQNESLLAAQAELQASLERYTELYDFAPVGYLILGPDGGIGQVNLTAATMLGVERSRLVNRRLGHFVCPTDRAVLTAFLKRVFEDKGHESCEVTLSTSAEPSLVVHIEAVAAPSRPECRAVLTEISTRKHAEEDLRSS